MGVAYAILASSIESICEISLFKLFVIRRSLILAATFTNFRRISSACVGLFGFSDVITLFTLTGLTFGKSNIFL